MIKNMDFLFKCNEYDTTRIFAKGLSEGFKDHGIQTRFLCMDPESCYTSLQKIWEDPPELTCSFSDITFGNKQPIADLLQLPHLSLFVDPIIYFLHQFSSEKSIVSYVDMHDGQLCDKIGLKNHFFLPHGGDPSFLKGPKSERPYDAVFFGSCIDYESLMEDWKRKYPSLIFNVLATTCDKVLSSCQESLLFLLIHTLNEKGIDQKEVHLPLLHQEIDQYIRGRDRVELLKALKNFKIHVWGDKNGPKGWSDYLKGQEHITIHPACTFEESIFLMQQAKIVLNSSPRFKSGSHERVFYGALTGALIISSSSLYIHNHFQEGTELFTYIPGQWEDLHLKLSSLDPFEILSMAQAGQSKVLNFHTWAHRAHDLISNLSSYFN